MDAAKPERAAVLAPERYQVFSGSALKVIAVIAMFIDHFTKRILTALPAYNQTLWTFHGQAVTWCVVGETIGRIAMPIFCFLLVEGFVYTHDRISYGLNLFVFALVSEFPFDLSRRLQLIDLTYQNVFWTLLLGYLGLCSLESLKDRALLRGVAVIGLALVSQASLCDYGMRGYATILTLYALRDRALEKTTIATAIQLSGWRAGLAFIPINLYNGKRGFVGGALLKYAFYLFYPAHLLFLYWLRLRLGV